MEVTQTSRKTLWISVAMGIIAAAVVWYFVFLYPARRQAAEVARQVISQLEQQQRTREAAQAVASPPVLSTEDIAPPSNPVKQKVPEVNPVKRANPFSEVFVNPFQ